MNKEIYHFHSFSGFLKNYLLNLPKKGRGEVSRIAHSLGISTTLVSQIISGQRYINEEQAFNLAKYFGFSQSKTDYLLLLVMKERAGTVELKKHWSEKIEAMKEQFLSLSKKLNLEKGMTEEQRGKFYSSPKFSMIRIFTSTHPEGRSIQDICKKFSWPQKEVEEMVEFLTQSNLCIWNGTRLKMGPQSTHLEKKSVYFTKNLSNWRTRAITHSDGLTDEELMYSVVVSLAHEDFLLLRERMILFINDFLKDVHASKAEDVACFNLDFFWLKY